MQNPYAKYKHFLLYTSTIKNQMMAQTNVVTGIAFIPSVGPDISWEPADLSIDFAPAQLAFDPPVQEPAARYVPGELSAVSYTHLDVYKRQFLRR